MYTQSILYNVYTLKMSLQNMLSVHAQLVLYVLSHVHASTGADLYLFSPGFAILLSVLLR